MITAIADTYSFFLENPAHRKFDLCQFDIQYSTATFSKRTYEEHRGREFESWSDAYQDWISYGRNAGLTYAQGKNTQLKIVLKVKDEPQLIVKWIEYHASIVGYENLLILNCGSRDSKFLEILEEYKSKIIIFDYEAYYDYIHSIPLNVHFYAFLKKNCRYFTVLDADEFIVGYKDGNLSRSGVIDILESGDENVYAGTWITNSKYLPTTQCGSIDFNSPIAFSLNHESLIDGTIRGKATIKTSIVSKIIHAGHNLAVSDVVAQVTPGSFGKLFILHIVNPNPELIRERSLKHLRSKGILLNDLLVDTEIDDFLRQKLQVGENPVHEVDYINRYLLNNSFEDDTSVSFDCKLLGGASGKFQFSEEFSNKINQFPFIEVAISSGLTLNE